MSSLARNHVKLFSETLSKLELAPKNIQVAKWNDWCMVSIYDYLNSNFISESVAMGIDKDENVAALKAISEYCEKRISKFSVDENNKISERSDGRAAFPVIYMSKEKSIELCRRNAFNESVERFSWATWWDNDEVFYYLKETDYFDEEYTDLKKEFDIEYINEIIIPTDCDIAVLIILVKLKKYGYVTGGSAGCLRQEKNGIYARAFGELLRHLLTFKEIQVTRNEDLSFYENRLKGFASGQWNKLVSSRIALKGSKIIKLPDLLIDKEIKHDFMNFITLYRCYFVGQPPFMGGEVNRLCI